MYSTYYWLPFMSSIPDLVMWYFEACTILLETFFTVTMLISPRMQPSKTYSNHRNTSYESDFHHVRSFITRSKKYWLPKRDVHKKNNIIITWAKTFLEYHRSWVSLSRMKILVISVTVWKRCTLGRVMKLTYVLHSVFLTYFHSYDVKTKQCVLHVTVAPGRHIVDIVVLAQGQYHLFVFDRCCGFNKLTSILKCTTITLQPESQPSF